jgi:hypothetical protein
LITAALFIGASFASFSSQAQPVSCNEAELGKLEASAGKMTDATRKAAVMKHINAAREQMRAQRLENCRIAMMDAQTAMSGG